MEKKCEFIDICDNTKDETCDIVGKVAKWPCFKSKPQAPETPPVSMSNSSDLLKVLRDSHEVLIFGKPSKLEGRYEVLFTGPEELMKKLLDQF